jgi:hypothetical protein
MINISFKNWRKAGIGALNDLSYLFLALIGSIQAAEAMGYTIDMLSPKSKHVLVVMVILFKFVEKMTVKVAETTEQK